MTDKKIDSRASQTKVKEQKKVWTPPSSLDPLPPPEVRREWLIDRWSAGQGGA